MSAERPSTGEVFKKSFLRGASKPLVTPILSGVLLGCASSYALNQNMSPELFTFLAGAASVNIGRDIASILQEATKKELEAKWNIKKSL